MSIAEADKTNPGTSVEPSSADSELAAAEAAIRDATSFADATHQSGETGADGVQVARTELSKDEREALSRDIAKRQRKLGTAELERLYPSAIVVNVDLKLNDPNIASSASRFLGLCDRTLYLINRFGSRFMTDSEVETTRGSIQTRIDSYALEAAQALEQGLALVGKAQEAGGEDWLSPSYTSATMDTQFSVKAKPTMNLVRALRAWDDAILQFAALEFNDGATVGQINTLRLRERKLVMDINRQCIRTINAFYKRQRDNSNKRRSQKEQSKALETSEASVDAVEEVAEA